MALRVLIAPDSFKGSSTATEVANAMACGLSKAWPTAELEIVPMSDGGDGFVDAMVLACGGAFEEVTVRGPLGSPIAARYALLSDGTAAIEMAEASGLRLLAPSQRDPLHATTFGTGELILAAIEKGARNLIVGVGGSATNDGGAGMAEALGVVFLDSGGKRLSSYPLSLTDIADVDTSGLHPLLRDGKVQITVACDVDAILCGPAGASHIFGPQKGATPETVEILDGILAKYAGVVEASIRKNLRDLPGSGAAGGLGFGLIAFLGATLKSGFDTVSDAAKLVSKVEKSSVVFTGEGRTDHQSRLGKTVYGVVRLAAQSNVPVVVISGGIQSGQEEPFADLGQVAITSITDGPATLSECMANAVPMISAAAYRTARMLDVGATLGTRLNGTPSILPEQRHLADEASQYRPHRR